MDSVQEFRGTTAGMLSSNGAGGGGQFDMVTKSGTNHFHGNLNEYHRDTDLEANEWFNNFDGVPRSPLVRNQYGGNIGGPIWKDKAFFFFDYNGRHDSLSTIADADRADGQLPEESNHQLLHQYYFGNDQQHQRGAGDKASIRKASVSIRR